MRRVSALLLLMMPAALTAAQPGAAAPGKPPTGLVATAASRSSVALSWTAGDPALTKYIVERKPLGAAWTPPPPPAKPVVVTTTAAATTLEDKSVDAYATYVYRVRALGMNDAPSAPSNEITVGPPPVGFTQIAIEPPGLHEPGNQYAPRIAMTLDANDDPALAYLFMDQNNDNDDADSTLWFSSWNRATYRWNAPVTVATIGGVNLNLPHSAFALAYDATTRQFGLAFMVKEDELRVSFSDGVAAWRTVSVEANSESAFGLPSLAMAKGQVYLAYYHGADGIRFTSGLATDPVDKWKKQSAPKLPDTYGAAALSPSTAVDATGVPAVAYWLDAESGYNRTIAFWRPGQPSAVKVADTAGYQNDRPDLNLTFGGGHAGIVFSALRDDNDYHQIWLARSTGGGAGWSAAESLPLDGGQNMGGPLSVVLDTQARASILGHVTGGNTSGTRCGVPKLIRQADASRWTTCAPETTGTPTKDEFSPVLAVAGNNKLYLAFRSGGAETGFKPGILLWRER